MSDPNSNDPAEIDTLRRTLAALLPAFAIPGVVLAQDAAKVQPGAYKVAFENDKVRVLEFNSRPGMGICGNGMHSHPAHLTVALSAAKARVKLPGGKLIEATNKLGDVFWSEAETHEVENITGRDVRALIIELKGKA
jgi:beta-alanine degradation protein BauB